MRIDEVEERELIPGTRVRFVHSDRMTVAYWHFDSGIDLPKHSHPHDQVTNILEGEFELTVAGVPEILSAGHFRVIPPDVVHSGRSITTCRIIDVFSPVREDYR
jgi:quercetin dioxygenase-like cupin family protein